MKKALWILALIVVLSTVIVLRNTIKENSRKKRAAANQLALAAYAQNLRPGLIRTNVEKYFRVQNTIFIQRCCYGDRSAFADAVIVGEEDAPWYCSEWPDYVIFEFAGTKPGWGFPPSGSDILKKIYLTSNGEGCL